MRMVNSLVSVVCVFVCAGLAGDMTQKKEELLREISEIDGYNI